MGDRTGIGAVLIGLPATLMLVAIMMEEYVFTYTTLYTLVFAAAVTAGVIGSLKIWQSGLGETGSNLIYWGSALGGLWLFLTVTAIPFFGTVPFWPYIYTVLSLMYVLGCMLVVL